MQLRGDLRLAATLFVQRDDVLVDCHSPLLAHLFVGFMPLKWQRLVKWFCPLKSLLEDLFDSGIVSAHDARNCFSQILGEVKTVRDLNRVGSPFSRPLSIRTATISTDHFDVRMHLEPSGSGGLLTIR